ncbi:MAG: glucose-1-phosphate cytidylyltransferase [Chitinivibrionales bacterium]|nr:glucose-1-phosphate cytidylyltransferase [Chitinivibrionales bacterium]
MKVVILAGGFGTRISEESQIKPKPMIEIGGRPILWHIMKIYSHYGFNDFIICLGYRGYVIKEYFAHYFLHESDVTFDFSRSNEQIVLNHSAEPWRVTLVNTGLNTMTGGRIKRIKKYVEGETFMLTYGDGLANTNINQLLEFHKSHKKVATLTAVQPEGRYGVLTIDATDTILSFSEKTEGKISWINGGFFVLEPEVFNYIDDDTTSFERKPLEKLASDRQLKSFKHPGFWYAMDKLSDKLYLEDIWNLKKAPWKVWSDQYE